MPSQAPSPLLSRRLRAAAAFLLLFGSSLSCGSQLPTAQASSASTDISTCPPSGNPFVLQLSSSESAEFLSQAQDGAVAIVYEGCSLRFLTDCRGNEAYDYRSVTEHQSGFDVSSADELRAKLPLLSTQLAASFDRATRLQVVTQVVGTFHLPQGSAKFDKLRGSNCKPATHVITAFTVGAYEVAESESRSVGGSLHFAEAHRTGSTRIFKAGGVRRACAEGGDHAPPKGCGAPIQLFVTPVVKEGADEIGWRMTANDSADAGEHGHAAQEASRPVCLTTNSSELSADLVFGPIVADLGGALRRRGFGQFQVAQAGECDAGRVQISLDVSILHRAGGAGAEDMRVAEIRGLLGITGPGVVAMKTPVSARGLHPDDGYATSAAIRDFRSKVKAMLLEALE